MEGNALFSLTKDNLLKLGFSLGPAVSLVTAVDKLKSIAGTGELAIGMFVNCVHKIV